MWGEIPARDMGWRDRIPQGKVVEGHHLSRRGRQGEVWRATFLFLLPSSPPDRRGSVLCMATSAQLAECKVRGAARGHWTSPSLLNWVRVLVSSSACQQNVLVKFFWYWNINGYESWNSFCSEPTSWKALAGHLKESLQTTHSLINWC